MSDTQMVNGYEVGDHCNDAVLALLREKLLDILQIEQHTLSDISNVCVERHFLERIKDETENQIVLLEEALRSHPNAEEHDLAGGLMPAKPSEAVHMQRQEQQEPEDHL